MKILCSFIQNYKIFNGLVIFFPYTFININASTVKLVLLINGINAENDESSASYCRQPYRTEISGIITIYAIGNYDITKFLDSRFIR